VEQRRRQHAASRIAAREAQRAKTARLRKQMERDGYAPDVIALVVAEMAGAA
jgi:DNA-binding protein H-NS